MLRAARNTIEVPALLDRLIRHARRAIPVRPVTRRDFAAWRDRQPKPLREWIESTGFKPKPGRHLLLPGSQGGLAGVLLGVEAGPDIWSYGGLPFALPSGDYRIDAPLDAEAATRAALGWALGSYAFSRYKAPPSPGARLVWPRSADRAAVERTASAIGLVRDLINTPAEDMGPAELAAAAGSVAKAHGARLRIIVGDALLKRNYPTIHAVGRASSRAPRLVDLRWGARGPRVTLVGKGVCFDSGGLDLKSAEGMSMMKKDMGGAAHVLALGQMVMAAKLPVRLRVLIPAVENSVSGNAFRPRDVIRTRKGLTVEVGNTDAEGRLVLCDALAEADAEHPDLLIDCATLTGAARVALGPDLPALFCNDDEVADRLLRHGRAVEDPLWRLPLHRPYRQMLESKVADLNNISAGSFAGAITAALYLQEFVASRTPWIHIDIMAWNPRSRPGRPEGGEATGLRALYALVEETAGRGGRARSRGRRGR